MVYKEHLIELWVNGNKVELESQNSLNMRLNTVLFDPTKISSTQADYSYEFEIPCTTKNNIIFDYANNLGKLNKFHQKYNAEVYADGSVIFRGVIVLNGVKENKYQINLVNVKRYSLEEIFGDMTMDKIKNMKITFDGVDSINYINDLPSLANTPARFPFISYGAFQKTPSAQTEAFNEYSSKFDLDSYNMWYVESFPPSANLLLTMKRAFETKGYKVGGDVYSNPMLNDIYMSTNLAEGQTPNYNIGNPNFGLVDLDVTLNATQGLEYEQQLKFPYFKCFNPRDDATPTVYNWESVDIFSNLVDGEVTVNHSPSYLYQPNEGIIVIPADGWYKVEMSATTLITTSTSLTVGQYGINSSYETELSNISIPIDIKEFTPIEIQLVKNYDDNIELIKGKINKQYRTGRPTGSFDIWLSCFPHEDPYNAKIPTEENDLVSRNRTSNMGGKRSDGQPKTEASNNEETSESGNFTGYRGGTRGGTIDFNSKRKYKQTTLGYVYNDGEVHCFDQAVTNNFICGISSLSDGVASVMKNGYSWTPIVSEKNEVFAPVMGYSFIKTLPGEPGQIVAEQTDVNENTYINTPYIGRVNINGNSLTGNVSCMVWLNKNDVLELKTIHRGYEDEVGNKVSYNSTTNVHLSIRAFSPRSAYDLEKDKANRYDAKVEFDALLNIADFFNKETKVSDWMKNTIDAFNFELIQNGNNIFINSKKKLNLDYITTVDIDDKTNTKNAESLKIDYPKSMAVKYRIDQDEWGFERSAVAAAGGDESILNTDDWVKYANSGYTVIELNDDEWETSTSEKQLQFSYTWYQNFNWYSTNSGFTPVVGSPVTIRIPCISKFSYMIDGYDYEESMKHDGYSQPQRFWFKPVKTEWYEWTRTYPPQKVYIALPSNRYSDGTNLSYKNTEKSLYTNFFNVNAYLASNYVNIDVYLTPDEYNRIKNGSLVHFGSDLYLPVSIDAFDPTGVNPTTLRLMKRV